MPDPERVIPDDPLEFIRGCIRERKVLWTYHVQMRLRGRSISRKMILEAVESFEIIESYPEDKYLPSYLIYAHHGENVFHTLFAADVSGGNVRVITAYRPSMGDWQPDMRTRRRKP